MVRAIHPYCLSSFLAFRYVVDPAAEWVPGIKPEYPEVAAQGQIPVETMEEIEGQLRAIIARKLSPTTGILLSGGIDSAILAALLPRGTRAYTIRFNAARFLDESIQARVYAERLGLRHSVVAVDWADYAAFAPALMVRKKAPLHAIEVALHKAARAARADGLDALIVGNGADSTFGGMDKLLARDWTLEEFYDRYTFVDPFRALRDPVDLRSVYRPYLKADGLIDVQRFLKTVHGLGIIQSFENAIRSVGLSLLEPFEQLRYVRPLDLARIRAGESKYLLKALFRRLFAGMEPPEKIPFARPMDTWLADWRGPGRPEFKSGVDWGAFGGDQRWLLHSLGEFLDLLDAGKLDG
ncbi:MAG TPA: asparagine synthase C-terminal domain-containing protein [Kiritimatiellia bacterium]|nr:asparagine synthase C-terminal domain-containing protein [Kiritimatiellia bacterium]